MTDPRQRNQEFETMSTYNSDEPITDDDTNEELRKYLLKGEHVILCGPPGTGKTRAIELIQEELKDEIGASETVQFHPSYSYQDFIEGYKIKDGKYVEREGIFLNFLDKCKGVEDSKIKLFIIDEINRGDIPSIFGELMYLLDAEEGRSVKTAKFGTEVSLPPKLVMLGTMNTADRNVQQLDLALRRRFKFLFIKPDYVGLTSWLNRFSYNIDEFSINDYVTSIRLLNTRITGHPMLGKNMMLGQSLFVPKGDDEIDLNSLTNIFNDTILPQLEAYIGFGNRKELDELLGTPDIRMKLDLGLRIRPNDLINLINLLTNAQD